MSRLCKCGCGDEVTTTQQYIYGHKKKEPQLCECGCRDYTRPGRKFILYHGWIGRKHRKESIERISKNSVGNKGRKFSADHKRKISESHKGEKHYLYGKSMPLSQRRNISLSLKGRKILWVDKLRGENHPMKRPEVVARMLGENNPAKRPEVRRKLSERMLGENNGSWKGGVSFEPYCEVWVDKDFKESIKERDDYKCQNPDCWRTSKNICLHHIDYNKKNCVPWNIITVCLSCNARANYNREYWTSLYQNVFGGSTYV